MADVEVEGSIAPGFERVGDALAKSFREHGEVGASVSVVVDGETKVDIWAGHADKERTRPWAQDTIVNLYSTTKGVAAAEAAILVDRGLLDVEAPVVRYWPEFGEAGKQDIPVKWLLSHQAGLPAIDEPLPPGGALHWPTVIGALERQKPEWIPGSEMGYHAITYGWLIGEVIRRISGMSPGAFLQKEISRPLGIDLFIGTSAAEDVRTAEMIPPQGAPALPTGPDPTSLPARALGIANPPAGANVNSREWRAAELPAANGHGNARALARLYGAMARGGDIGGVKLMGPGTIERFAREEAACIDKVIGFEVRRGLGFILNSPGGRYHWGPNAGTFGHSGAGGSLGFADPRAKLGFGYAMNQMTSGLSADPRWANLIDAAYACL